MRQDGDREVWLGRSRFASVISFRWTNSRVPGLTTDITRAQAHRAGEISARTARRNRIEMRNQAKSGFWPRAIPDLATAFTIDLISILQAEPTRAVPRVATGRHAPRSDRAFARYVCQECCRACLCQTARIWKLGVHKNERSCDNEVVFDSVGNRFSATHRGNKKG